MRHNYQAPPALHAAYWQPLQLYDLVSDPAEQHNLISPAERAAVNVSGPALRELRADLTALQAQLRAHMDATEAASASGECAYHS